MVKLTLFNCVKTNDLAGFIEILGQEPELVNSIHPDMDASLLMVCIYYGRADFIEYLRSLKLTLSIWEASALGETKIVQSALTATPTLLNAYSPDGFTSLGLAAYFGKIDTAQALIEAGADVNLPANNPMKVAPINSAGANRDAELSLQLLKLLIENGADVNYAQQGGITVLHEAAHHGHLDKIDYLLSVGADPQLKNDKGETPSQMAAAQGHTEAQLRFD